LMAELNRRFDTEAEAMQFLESIKDNSFKVSKVETKPARRSPAPPFTTSTLQQEASRKLGFSVARTMQIAQQLYESGFITYMRTDSTNLSEMALDMASRQIEGMYGKNYVKKRRYHTKIKGAQEAHEAIRPTDMQATEINTDAAGRRLYELIWKRAIASQMADAELEKTTIEIDIDNHKERFCCSGEQVLFDGFLKVYFESTDDEEEEDLNHQLPSVKTGMDISLDNAVANQHYTQHPPRYTEASLVKKLEDLGIGRPSTYAPTISTILKREYVIKEDRGPQDYNVITLTLNPGKGITHSEKIEHLGAEKGKLFPTDIGTIVNQFLMEHFTDIMDYNFTAKVEKDFDDVANGTQAWRDVIDQFYIPFHRNVKQTQNHSKRTSGERLLGTDPASGKNVYAKIGRYGTLIQIGETNTDEKPKFASMKKGQSIESITLEEALDLFSLPRTLGEYEGQDVVVSIGRFGPYVRHDGKFYSLSKTDDPYVIPIERAIEIIKTKREQAAEKERLKAMFPHEIGEYEGEKVISNVGKFGPYLTYKGDNFRMPKNEYDPLTISLADAVAIIREMQEKKSKKKK
ncbi:MAG: DNA topoisomerase I, partial [Bacteroidales bacterium]|nr:DNA topoisomerase I [Bacteroidales bacterium]